MNERYLSVVQVAELLGTTERFPRRLVAERRIRYVKVGTHVRIAESAVNEYIACVRLVIDRDGVRSADVTPWSLVNPLHDAGSARVGGAVWLPAALPCRVGTVA